MSESSTDSLSENVVSLGVAHARATENLEKAFLLGAGDQIHLKEYLRTGAQYYAAQVQELGPGGDADEQSKVWQKAISGMEGNGNISDTFDLLRQERDKAIKALGDIHTENMYRKLYRLDVSAGAATALEEQAALQFVKVLTRARAMESLVP